jgi:hypothetical protein
LYTTPTYNTTTGLAAFNSSTTQQVNALAQNLIHDLLPVNGSTQRQLHGQPPIQVLINNRILGSGKLSLIGGLSDAAPIVGATPSTNQLNVVAAQSAINAAETSVLNGLGILQSGAFSGKH